LAGTPKTVTISREAAGWDGCFSCTDVPVRPLAPTGEETAIDLGIEAFATLATLATLADGQRIVTPGC
jgi:hypothetical protein